MTQRDIEPRHGERGAIVSQQPIRQWRVHLDPVNALPINQRSDPTGGPFSHLDVIRIELPRQRRRP